MREIKAGEYYRHFKGGQYQVTAIARDANTEEKVVVYQALYGEEEFWVRPYEEFASEVDREKYPDAEQTWRFEKIEEPQQMNPLLLRFLEAESYRDKLELFQAWEAYVDEQLEKGKNVILEIEIQGALKVREKRPDTLLLFVTPPNGDELKNRLTGRGTETQEVIEARLSRASEEAEGVEAYDYLLINDELDICVEELHEIIRSEHRRLTRQQNIEKIAKIREELQKFRKGEK